MKKVYMKPAMEIDRYTLDMSIAANCGTVVDNGPAVTELGITECESYTEVNPFGVATFAIYNVSFYENTCDCYYSAGGEGYWMS